MGNIGNVTQYMHQIYNSEVCEEVPLLACFLTFFCATLALVVQAWLCLWCPSEDEAQAKSLLHSTASSDKTDQPCMGRRTTASFVVQQRSINVHLTLLGHPPRMHASLTMHLCDQLPPLMHALRGWLWVWQCTLVMRFHLTWLRR